MKKELLLLFSVVVMLFSCTNVKKGPRKEKAESQSEIIAPTHVPSSKSATRDSSKAEMKRDTLLNDNYFFSDDTMCQNLSIKEISRNQEFEMPDKIQFKLILHNIQHQYDDKIFYGVAQLTSSDESFYDNSNKNSGAYFAADYNFNASTYKIKIRLDIERYEACVVSITTKQPETVLGEFGMYLKKFKFPNDEVMKRGKCK